MAGGRMVTGFFLPGFFLEVTYMASGTENRLFVLGACDRMSQSVTADHGCVVIQVGRDGAERYADVVRAALRLLSLETQKINLLM